MNNGIVDNGYIPALGHSHLGRVRIAMVGVNNENVAPCTIGNLNGETFGFQKDLWKVAAVCGDLHFCQNFWKTPRN